MKEEVKGQLPEAQRAKGTDFAEWCNSAVHNAPWTRGDRSTQGGVYIALELAEEAYLAHQLRYERGLAKLSSYDPRRFTWICDPTAAARDCVKVRDDQTGLIAAFPIWGPLD